ncbi:MAG TPA: exonuclease domain-containing protein [Cellulomonas sp.]
MTWHDGPLVGFDTETTGVDVGADRIVTAAVVRRDATGTRVRTWLIDPGVPIPQAATAVHGITTEQVRAQGRPPREALDEVAAALVATWRAGVPVVAFNACYDLSLLDAELRRHGLATVTQRLGRAAGPVLDPLVLDRAEERYRPGKRRLGDLCAVYGVETPEALHAAHVDVEATLDLLGAMVARHPHLAELDLATLQAYQVHAHLTWAESFNAWRDECGLPGPGAELDWPVRSVPAAAQWAV